MSAITCCDDYEIKTVSIAKVSPNNKATAYTTNNFSPHEYAYHSPRPISFYPHSIYSYTVI